MESRADPDRPFRDLLRLRHSRVADRFAALVGDIVETCSTSLLIRISPLTLAISARLFPPGLRNDRIELVLPPAGQVVKVWTMIGINDQSDREHPAYDRTSK
jgi:hypothetical protein